ncbi:MAG: Holliday junction resolvase RuvX [Candidatus Ancillula sp.]|jgi:putative Holliday junction resolvase|nr:Holliday junction resolvase RuvX [Candidatus Ancillula sp.]
MEKMKILGLDMGKARVGVAISDDEQKLAFPLETIQVLPQIRDSKVLSYVDDFDLLQRIDEIVSENKISSIVVGLPVSDTGKEKENCTEIRNFAEFLKDELGNILIHFEDERFTTVQAHSQLHDLGKKPSKSRSIVDQLAAVNILQSWLDKQLDC